MFVQEQVHAAGMQTVMAVEPSRPQAMVPASIGGLTAEQTHYELLLKNSIEMLAGRILQSGKGNIDGMRLVLRAALTIIGPCEAYVVHGTMDDVAKYVRGVVDVRVGAPEKYPVCFDGETLGKLRLE